MKTGDIILVPFPFAELTNRKVRPCVVICKTKDKYQDVVVSAISSVVPNELNENEILVEADSTNNLRATSIIKVDRIVTVKKTGIPVEIERKGGKLKIVPEKRKNKLDNLKKRDLLVGNLEDIINIDWMKEWNEGENRKNNKAGKGCNRSIGRRHWT